MRRIITYTIMFLGLCAIGLAQTPTPVPLTGNLGQIAGTPQGYSAVSLQLENCPTPVAVTGYSVIVQTALLLQANASGVITSTIWGNDQITCNGTTGNSQYGVTFYNNGTPSGTPYCIQVVSTQGVVNLNTQQPIDCAQSPPNPQDATFRNLNVNGFLQFNNGAFSGSLTGTLIGHATLDFPLSGGSLTGPFGAPAIAGIQVVGYGTNTSIHAALAALGSGGGMVWVPCGTYSDNVDITTNFVSIVGENAGCVIITPAAVSTPVFTIDALSIPSLLNVTLQNLTLKCPASTTCGDGILIRGNGTNQPNDGHFLSNVSIIPGNFVTSATNGFANGIDITGRTIDTTFDNVFVANTHGNGLNITGSAGPVNNLFIRSSQFNSAWNYGVYFNQTGISTASTVITFVNSTVQNNGVNTALVDCAGVYLNQVGGITFRNSYFENNCASNTTTAKIAQIRATGTVVQSLNARENMFNSNNNEWSIYDDAVQTTGEWDGNTVIAVGRGMYLNTGHALSAVHIGTNFGEPPPTIVPDSNGWTHATSSFPFGMDITQYNQSTVGSISAALSSDIWLANTVPVTITTIPGGHAGQILILRQSGTSTSMLTNNAGGAGSLELVGATSRTLSSGNSVMLVSDGTNWNEIIPGLSGASLNVQHVDSVMGGTCPSAGTVGSVCTSASIALPQAFPTSAFSVVCNVYNQTGIPTVSSAAIVDNQHFTVTIAALTATPVNGNVHCIAQE